MFIPGFLLFGPGGEIESKLEFKESSAVADPKYGLNISLM